MAQKNKRTIQREETLKKLFSLDSKLKFTDPDWNYRVKEAFNVSGSYSFETLVHTDLDSAEQLVNIFG